MFVWSATSTLLDHCFHWSGVCVLHWSDSENNIKSSTFGENIADHYYFTTCTSSKLSSIKRVAALTRLTLHKLGKRRKIQSNTEEEDQVKLSLNNQWDTNTRSM